eukprot:1985286-Pleurochrysis_carterae.AAC.2
MARVPPNLHSVDVDSHTYVSQDQALDVPARIDSIDWHVTHYGGALRSTVHSRDYLIGGPQVHKVFFVRVDVPSATAVHYKGDAFAASVPGVRIGQSLGATGKQSTSVGR